MRVTAWDAGYVTITGKDLAAARSRAGLSQKELADLLNHSERIVQKWEATKVHPGKEPLVRAVLGSFLTDSEEPPLSSYSNWALLMEIGRRLEEGWRRKKEPRDSEFESGHDVSEPSGGAPSATPGTGPSHNQTQLGAKDEDVQSEEDHR